MDYKWEPQIALHVLSNHQNIMCSMLMKVNDPLDGYALVRDKISGCSCLRDSTHEVDDYVSHLLVWSRGYSTVVQHYSAGKISDKAISEGGLKHDIQHKQLRLQERLDVFK